MNTDIIVRDLTQHAPHSPRARLAGFVIAHRAVDKCRASLAGKLGEYHYDCPLDNMLFSFKGITGEQFKTAVQASANDDEVGVWLLANGTPKTTAEIKTWSDQMEASSPMKNPERRAQFMDNCSKLMLNPEMNSTFDWLEADDRASFSRRPKSSVSASAAQPTVGEASAKNMEPSAASAVPAQQDTVFPQTIHHLRPKPKDTSPHRKSQKRNNTFSMSRDTREDRGTRQMKTTHNPQSFARGR